MRIKKRVLLLDDDLTVVRMMSRVLGQEFDVTYYLKGDHALNAIRQETFDAVVSDMDIGAMTGVDFYREVVKIRPELATRFIFHTGSPNPPKTDVPMLKKPATGMTLRDRVRALVT
jgi:DNA-binding NtrC family response regulator